MCGSALQFEAGGWRWRASVFYSCPPGEASEQHRHDASEEYTIESSGAADRGDRRAEPSDGVGE
jgi:hypothetical protein